MTKRITAIGLLMSLMPLGHPLIIKTGTLLTTAGVILSVPEVAQANDAGSYVSCGMDKDKSGDYSGAIIDYTKALKINPNHAWAYLARGYAKNNLGAIKKLLKAAQESFR